jgi:hypothetical protein
MNTEREIINGQQDEQSTADNNVKKESVAQATEDIVATSGDEEHTHDHEEDDHEHLADYHGLSKKELLAVIEPLQHEEDLRKVDAVLKQVRPVFDHIKEEERNEALHKFLDEGGEETDFDFRYDEVSQRFENIYRTLKEKRKKQQHEQEKSKEKNLENKNTVLEKLRHIVDGEETTTSINTLKKIQEEWKAIGPVPAAQARELYANYSALLDRFYNNRSIYFELKELDRKKNLEAKNELVDKAEKLLEEESFNKAVKELNELHEEYKHIGPVPKEEQDALWNRFKAISDKVYSKRREYIEHMKSELDNNYVLKSQLADLAAAYASFNSDRIDDWNKKSQEIMELQQQWKAIGGIPRNKSDEVTKRFWGSFKTFFSNKSQFFKGIEEKRAENLRLKTGLCEKAEALQESEDFESTAETLKELQQEWRNIGPVPHKYKNSIYDRFKAAVDHFFDRRRNQHSETEAAYKENFKKKMELLDGIEQMSKNNKGTVAQLEEFKKEWNQLGFVPKKDITKVQKRFNEVTSNFIENSTEIDPAEKVKVKLTFQVSSMRHNPDAQKNLHMHESGIRKKIQSIENDLSLWKNNLEFFANSKNADKFRSEFNTKIEQAEQELGTLKEQLKIINSL